jgi:hypothetical protein
LGPPPPLSPPYPPSPPPPSPPAAATDGLGLLGDAVVLVVEAREDIEIARGVRSALA